MNVNIVKKVYLIVKADGDMNKSANKIIKILFLI